MLYNIVFEDGTNVLVEYLELLDAVKAFNYLGLNYKAHLVEDKMYAIHWYDYIDDEWSVIWCTKDNFNINLTEVKNAEVEYCIKEYN